MVRWSLFYLFLYLYRSLYSYLGEAVVRGATKLGDSGEFLRAGVLDFSLTALLSSTLATRTLGAIASTLSGGNVVLSHMFFQTLGFIGIVYFMAALAPKDRAWAAILVVLPSFTVWTSIASKEAVVLLGVGLLSGYLIRLFREDRIPITLPLLLGIYILAVFKLQFLGAFMFVAVAAIAGRHVRQHTTLLILGGLVSLAPLYFFRDWIIAESFRVVPHFFDYSGHSTRQNVFWVEPNDVFLKAPEGIARAFFGPNWAEAGTGVIQLAAFAESAILVALLVLILIIRLPRASLFNFIVWLFAMFWILFPNYPLGVANPGSAVRYRSGWILFVFFLFVFVLSREAYTTWRGSRRPRSPDGELSQAPGPSASLAGPAE